MIDFDLWTRQDSDQPGTSCDSYAVIREGSSLQQTICGSDERTRNVYVSRSNIIEIFRTRMHTTGTPNFIMEYNGTIFNNVVLLCNSVSAKYLTFHISSRVILLLLSIKKFSKVYY